MDQLVILSKLEQEYLLGAIEAAPAVRDLRRLFLWTQGQIQALLPHQVLVCLHFGADDQVLKVECLQGIVLGPCALERLVHPIHGLASRLARVCRSSDMLPAMLQAGSDTSGHPLAAFQADLQGEQFDNVLLHGSERLPGGSTFFALFGMPHRPGPRQAYFFELLLPHLHMALLRLQVGEGAVTDGAVLAAAPAMRQISPREMQILHWVREGKSNQEVGQILGISGLTVKNHLQRIYKTLGVSNRTQAVARGISLRLLDSSSARA